MMGIIFIILAAFCSVAQAGQPDINKVKYYLEELQCNQTCLEPAVYLKAHAFLIRAKVFKNNTLKDSMIFVNEIDNWKSPKYLDAKFPYYHAGYDYEDRPVWVGEVGRFNVREIVEKGPEASENLKLYLFQAVLRMLKSMIAQDTDKREIREVFLLGDWDQLDISQVRHVPTILYVIDLVRTYLDFLIMGVGYSVAVNVGYAAHAGFELARPVLGRAFEKIELFGTNKSKWVPRLKRLLPPESLPTWYGGDESFKPIQVYG